MVFKNNCDIQSAFLPLYFIAIKIHALHMTLKAAGLGT